MASFAHSNFYVEVWPYQVEAHVAYLCGPTEAWASELQVRIGLPNNVVVIGLINQKQIYVISEWRI